MATSSGFSLFAARLQPSATVGTVDRLKLVQRNGIETAQ